MTRRLQQFMEKELVSTRWWAPQPGTEKLTFANIGAGNKRKLRVTASPNMTLTMQHVPQHCRRARTVLLGPLTPQDLNAASFINFKQGGRLPQLGAFAT